MMERLITHILGSCIRVDSSVDIRMSTYIVYIYSNDTFTEYKVLPAQFFPVTTTFQCQQRSHSFSVKDDFMPVNSHVKLHDMYFEIRPCLVHPKTF